MNRITSAMPMMPAIRLWFRNCSPSVAEICSLDSSLMGNGSEPNFRIVTRLLAPFRGNPADPARRDLDLAVRDRLVDPRRRDDRSVEDDREVVVDVLARVLSEQLRTRLRTVVLELEGDRQASRLVLTDGGGF